MVISNSDAAEVGEGGRAGADGRGARWFGMNQAASGKKK